MSLFFFMSICYGITDASAQQLQPPSAELQNFIAQVNQVYVTRNGLDFDTFAGQYPHTLAAMIGHALWQQECYAGQDPQAGPSLEKLKGELNAYFNNLAQYCTYMDVEGNPVSADSLWNAASSCMGPQGDVIALQNFGVKKGDMPSVLTAGQPDNSRTGTSYGKLKDENAIELLGYDAPPSGNQGITPGPEDVDPSTKYLDKDTILGMWEETDEYNTEPPAFLIEVRKMNENGQDLYVGYCRTIRDPNVFSKRYQFGTGTVLFKVRYDTCVVNSSNAEDCPISYEGEGLGLANYNQGPWTWIKKGEIRVWKGKKDSKLGICYPWPERFSVFRKIGQR